MKKSDREIVFNKFGGLCYLCGEKLKSGWHSDHHIPIRRNTSYNRQKRQWLYDGTCERPEHDTLDNQMPSCASCNINKRDRTLESFRSFIQGFLVSLNRDSTQYKIAKRYGLIQETEKSVVFYFETL